MFVNMTRLAAVQAPRGRYVWVQVEASTGEVQVSLHLSLHPCPNMNSPVTGLLFYLLTWELTGFSVLALKVVSSL